MMSDQELVIKGLEQVIDDGWMWKHADYYARVVSQAIDILKAQKPRVLGWDEIKNYPVVYGEFRGVKEIYPLITSVNMHGEILTWNPGINISGEFMLLTADEEDRKNTRCWNREPTEEQRKAVPLDED